MGLVELGSGSTQGSPDAGQTRPAVLRSLAASTAEQWDSKGSGPELHCAYPKCLHPGQGEG